MCWVRHPDAGHGAGGSRARAHRMTPDNDSPDRSQSPPAVPPPPTPRQLWLIRIATVVAIVGAGVAMAVLSGHLDEFRRYAGSPLGLLLYFGLSLVSNATLLLPVPGLALTSLVGSAAPPILVGIIGGTGQTLGEFTGYLAGFSGQTLVQNHPSYPRVATQMRRYGVFALFVLAALPNPLFDVAGMVAGVLRMPPRQFLIGTAAGKIVKNVAFAYMGDWVMHLFGVWAMR